MKTNKFFLVLVSVILVLFATASSKQSAPCAVEAELKIAPWVHLWFNVTGSDTQKTCQAIKTELESYNDYDISVVSNAPKATTYCSVNTEGNYIQVLSDNYSFGGNFCKSVVEVNK